MHVKDSGTVLLTKEDLAEYALGKVSNRVKELWGFTYEELKEVYKNNNYRIIDGPEIRRIEEISGETTSLSAEKCSGTCGEDGPKD